MTVCGYLVYMYAEAQTVRLLQGLMRLNTKPRELSTASSRNKLTVVLVLSLAGRILTQIVLSNSSIPVGGLSLIILDC